MVITLDKRKRPLGHCTEKRARKLLEAGRVVVYRYYPFTIIIKDKDSRDIGQETGYRIKIDPGSNDTGMAVVDQSTDKVILYLQIKHRASRIVEDIRTRHNARRNRRSRETWYRHPHSFRHLFAIEFLKRDSNLALLADLMGHSSINTTAIYTRMSREEQKRRLEEAMDW